MKISATNNKKNISHKAYFKPNSEFMNLYQKANKTENLAKTFKFFKEIVPNHEIEITCVLKNKKYPNWIGYEVVNKVTQKIETVLTTIDSNGLIGILSHFNLFRDSDFFKFDDEKTDIDCFEILTKKRLIYDR